MEREEEQQQPEDEQGGGAAPPEGGDDWGQNTGYGTHYGVQQQQYSFYPYASSEQSYGYYMTNPPWAQYQHQFPYRYHYPVQHMEGVPLPPGIPGLGGSTDPLEAVLGPFPCARLRSLPYDSTLEDILVLFQGLVVIDVVIIGGGDAFVIFANPMDYQMALQRNRQTIGRRFVEISAASRAEYYEAVAIIHEQERGARISSSTYDSRPSLARGDRSLSDPPPAADTASTVAALWASGASSNTMSSTLPSTGYGDSMSLPGNLTLGGRISSGGSVGRSVLHAPITKRTGGGIQVGEHTGYLRMRGLPFSANKDDIYKFFFGYNPIQESIVLTFRNDGRATGEAYVGFASPDDAKRAMELHRRMMGNRYIELFISNQDEQGRALARFGNR